MRVSARRGPCSQCTRPRPEGLSSHPRASRAHAATGALRGSVRAPLAPGNAGLGTRPVAWLAWTAPRQPLGEKERHLPELRCPPAVSQPRPTPTGSGGRPPRREPCPPPRSEGPTGTPRRSPQRTALRTGAPCRPGRAERPACWRRPRKSSFQSVTGSIRDSHRRKTVTPHTRHTRRPASGRRASRAGAGGPRTCTATPHTRRARTGRVSGMGARGRVRQTRTDTQASRRDAEGNWAGGR